LNCRSCGGTDLTEVVPLGNQYLSDFRVDDQRPPRYPLNAVFCHDCTLVQLDETVPRELMYHERYGFKSGVNDTIRADLKSIVDEALAVVPWAETWLDIACNDGTLLSYVPDLVYREGIDPVEKYATEARQHADSVINDYFRRAYFRRGPFHVITSLSMFYDIDDPNEFVASVKEILDPKGVWVVQQNYLLSTLQLNAVDNFVHEHITYYGMLSLQALLERHGLEVFRVSTSSINGGSFRTLIGYKGAHPVEPSVSRQRHIEIAYGLNGPAIYGAFKTSAGQQLTAFADLVFDLNVQGKRVFVYGASTRGSTLLQAAELGADDFECGVDRNPEKVGKTWAPFGVPIISEQQAREDNPDYMIVSPWFFKDEFVRREHEWLCGTGAFIFPLPKLKTVRSVEVTRTW
jgi:SAM-dependent methyltransferase